MKAIRFASMVVLSVGMAASAAAEVASKKFDWQPVNGVQETDVADGKVVVSQVEFDTGSTLKGTPIRKSSAQVKVRIDNNGDRDAEVGVAVVVFDAEGNVVAAGSNGTKWGFLNKGDRTYYAIDFPYVYRRLDQAASFMVTVETREKGSARAKRWSSPETTESSSESESGSASHSEARRSASSSSSARVESEPLPPQ